MMSGPHTARAQATLAMPLNSLESYLRKQARVCPSPHSTPPSRPVVHVLCPSRGAGRRALGAKTGAVIVVAEDLVRSAPQPTSVPSALIAPGVSKGNELVREGLAHLKGERALPACVQPARSRAPRRGAARRDGNWLAVGCLFHSCRPVALRVLSPRN